MNRTVHPIFCPFYLPLPHHFSAYHSHLVVGGALAGLETGLTQAQKLNSERLKRKYMMSTQNPSLLECTQCRMKFDE